MSLLAIIAHPGSKHPRIEQRDGTCHVYVRERAQDGQANAAILQALSRHLDIAPARLRIIRGQGAKTKAIAIMDP